MTWVLTIGRDDLFYIYSTRRRKTRFRKTWHTGKKRFEFVGLAYQGKDFVFRFIIEYSSLMDFGPLVIGLFLEEEF
jgi:hypothetical protein